MRTNLVLAGLAVGALSGMQALAGEGAVTAPGAKAEKVAGGFEFTEGATCDAAGNVFFTDQPNDRIMKWSVDGKLSTFMKPAGRSNGMMFDPKGNLLACADGKNQLWLIRPDEKVTVLVKDYQGKLLNGPNDVWRRPDGGLYFTDPYYKRDYWKRGPMEQDVQGVYYLAFGTVGGEDADGGGKKAGEIPAPPTAATASGPQEPPRSPPLVRGGKKAGKTPTPPGRLVRVVDDLKTPNGITGTPDGKTLYVSDIGAQRTYAYDIRPDGSLAGKRLFCELGSDGMTIDSEGNVYLTGKGVSVFDKHGRQIEHIDVPEPWSANVCFGGKDRQTLFITASKGLYAVKMRVRGVDQKGGK